jgi:hypothetical protein
MAKKHGKKSVKKGTDWAGPRRPAAWTKEDVRELKGLARQKAPMRKIARSLKRTVGATRQKAFSLGLTLGSRRTSKRTSKKKAKRS